MPSKKTSLIPFGAGLVLGLAGGALLARRRKAHSRMPHIDTWQQVLAQEREEVGAAMLAARMQARYDDLYAGRPHFTQAALREHLENSILPGLALYQALLEEMEDEEAALAETEVLFEAAFGGARKWLPYLDRLPRPFAFLRWAGRSSLQRNFPPEGWETEMVEDSEDSFAFNMQRCFYLDMLTAYGAPELTPLYCRLDDLLYGALPPSIAWRRTQTLGLGDECCDFRFDWVGTPPATENV